MDRMQPPLRQYRPPRDRQLRRPKAKPMAPLRKKMKFRRNLRVLERLKVDKGVLDMSRVIILRLKKKCRRSLRGWLERWTNLAVSPAKPARIDDHLKVGTSIDGRWRNTLALKIGMSAQHRTKVRSSRKTNYADTVRINVPLRGVSPSEPHSLLRIFQVFDIFRIVAFFRHPILHQNARHTQRVQPITDFGPFDVVRKPDVTSARKDKG